MTNDDDFLFSQQDFNSIQISVALRNATAKTSIGRGMRTMGDEAVDTNDPQFEVYFMEFQTGGFAIDAPERTAAMGHILEINIDVSGAQLPLTFTVSTKVRHIQKLGSGREQIHCELIEFDERYYNAFKDLFSSRQREIEEFFKQVRGG